MKDSEIMTLTVYNDGQHKSLPNLNLTQENFRVVSIRNHSVRSIILNERLKSFLLAGVSRGIDAVLTPCPDLYRADGDLFQPLELGAINRSQLLSSVENCPWWRISCPAWKVTPYLPTLKTAQPKTSWHGGYKWWSFLLQNWMVQSVLQGPCHHDIRPRLYFTRGWSSLISLHLPCWVFPQWINGTQIPVSGSSSREPNQRLQLFPTTLYTRIAIPVHLDDQHPFKTSGITFQAATHSFLSSEAPWSESQHLDVSTGSPCSPVLRLLIQNSEVTVSASIILKRDTDVSFGFSKWIEVLVIWALRIGVCFKKGEDVSTWRRGCNETRAFWLPKPLFPITTWKHH